MSAGLSVGARKSNSVDITLFQFERTGRTSGLFVPGSFRTGSHAQFGNVGRDLAAAFLERVDATRDDAALAGELERGFLVDDAASKRIEAGVVEGAPAEGLVRLDDLVKAFPFAFTLDHRLLGAEIGAHDFDDGEAASADFGSETLADDPTKRVGQPVTNLFLFVGLEQAEDAVDGLAGVDG